ncbi:MAG: DUF4440 domain-containing protein [Candidatus Didemnitutus sp.]|nr:DUF4440 domain-containing protein [Candidatus Didemnitutus sp.]
MKIVPKACAVLGLSVFAGGSWLSAQSSPTTSQTMNPPSAMKSQSDTDKIIATVQQVATAMERGDLAAALATYEPNAHLVVQPGQTVSGPALGEALKGFIAMKPKFTMNKHDVVISGDIALHISPWSMEATDPASGAAIKGGGLSLAVLRHQADGRWLMVTDNPYGGAVLAPPAN